MIGEKLASVVFAADGIIGGITPPPGVISYGDGSGNPSGLIMLLNNVLRLMILAAGIFALINFILAGFAFMTAAGDPKKVELAWAKIWQSMVGLLIIVGSFALAALVGQLIFKDPGAILKPVIYGPGNDTPVNDTQPYYLYGPYK